LRSAEDLIDAARSETGLHDFGDEGWRDGLEVLVDSAHNEAQLNAVGRATFESHVTTLLANRLQVTEWCRRHPEIRKERIERPLFVIGLVRTGSTRLHHLLAQDPRHRVLQRWETLRSCPPPDARRTEPDPRIAVTEEEDRALGLALPEFRAMHDEPPDGPTECVMLLRQSFRSFCFETQWNVPSWAEWFQRCDMAPAYAYHKRVLQLLQWKSPGRWALKSPVHSMGLEELVAEYPDACLVMTHRDPSRVLASICSLTTLLTSLGSDADHADYIARRWRSTLEESLRRIMAFREKYPEVLVHDLHYRDLVADPMAALHALYAAFGDSLTREAETAIAAHAKAHPQGEFGAHRYVAADLGLDLDREREHFRDYLDFYAVEVGV
jgi:hypothetical protein